MSLVPPHIEALVPYKPGKSTEEVRRELGLSRIVKLASNENPLGPSPRAVERAKAALSEVHIYPDGGLALRRALAARFDVPLERVVVGNGLEGILLHITRTFLHGDDQVLTADGTFVGIYVLTRARGMELATVPLKNYHYDLEAMADAVTERTKVIYLANPNNPTGTIFTRREFERFMKRVPDRVLVVMDEAYYEYAVDNPDYPDSLPYGFDNVITLRAFSKSYGLAGLRIGYGFAREEICRNLLKVKVPFEPSHPAAQAGLGALEDAEFLKRTLEVCREGKEFLTEEFRRLGLSFPPTNANFFMVDMKTEEEALAVVDGLQRQGVIVRPLHAFGLPHCIRITIGKREENEMLVSALNQCLTPVSA